MNNADLELARLSTLAVYCIDSVKNILVESNGSAAYRCHVWGVYDLIFRSLYVVKKS